MVKVRILKSVAGHDFSYVRGDTPSLNEKRASEWIRAGIAKPFEGETAVKTSPETTVMPTPKATTAPITETRAELKTIGGGWYELPNGERVRGKKKALEMLKNAWI